MNNQEIREKLSFILSSLNSNPEIKRLTTEELMELIHKDQALREIDVRIDELEKFNRYEKLQGIHKYFIDRDKNVAFTINDRIQELQAQKDKLKEQPHA